MQVKSIYSKSFHSDMLTRHKYDELRAQAIALRSIRNEISQIVNANPMLYHEMSNKGFQTEMLPHIKDRVSSNFTKQLCDDVFVKYENRFKQLREKMRFDFISKIEFNLYKRNTARNKIGDLKSLKKTIKSTELSIILTYLCRYGNETTLDYIQSQLIVNPSSEKSKFYQSILSAVNKFGFNRLMALAIMKRQRILKRYSNPIIFTKLTFRGRSRLSKDIVSYNTNFKSVIDAFVNIGWLSRGSSITIPVKYSKTWHTAMSKYTNGTDTSYTICFDEKQDRKSVV